MKVNLKESAYLSLIVISTVAGGDGGGGATGVSFVVTSNASDLAPSSSPLSADT